MKKTYLVVMVVAMLLQGCSARYNEPYRGNNYNSKRLTEVSAKQIIRGEASAKYLFGFIKIYDDTRYAKDVTYYQSKVRVYNHDKVSQIKAAAAYKALRNSDTDVLLSPTYVIETSNYLLWKSLNVTVYAVKGNVVGYQNLNPRRAFHPCLD